MATDRQGATIAVGDVYLLAGKVVRIEGTRVLVRDAAGKLAHVEAAEIAKVDGALGGHGHDIDDVTDLGDTLDAINFALVGKAAVSHTHGAGDINAGTLGAARLPALTGAVTSSAGSASTAFGSFKANAILMNMTTSSGVPTAVDGVDAASNLLAYLGGSFIVPAWSQSTLALGGLAI